MKQKWNFKIKQYELNVNTTKLKINKVLNTCDFFLHPLVLQYQSMQELPELLTQHPNVAYKYATPNHIHTTIFFTC